MQKFTIFTVLMSVIVITVIAELVVHDYLEQLKSSNFQANTLQSRTAFEEFVAPFEQAEEKKSDETNKLIKTLEQLSNKTPEDTTQDTPFARISKLLSALQIPGLKLTPADFQGKLFQLIDTQTIDLKSIQYALLQDEKNPLGAVYEIEFRTSIDAENAFDEIRILSNSFSNIDTNQTNQFGDRSFYINNLVKVAEVFIVIQKNNKLYAFAYKKEHHDKFKTFFTVLF